MVGEDLLLLLDAIAGDVGEPSCEPLVELSARTAFGIASYAESRINRWRNRNASSPASRERSGPHQIATDQPHQRRAHARRIVGEGRHGSDVELLAHDGRALDRRRAPRPPAGRGGRRSGPAPSAGSGRLKAHPWRPSRRRRGPAGRRRSASRASPRRTTALPSAASRIRARASSGNDGAPEEVRHQLDALLVGEPLQQDRGRVQLAAAPGRPADPAGRVGPCTPPGSARPGTSPRCARSGRGTSARPSGCRRTRPRGVGSERRPPGNDGPPRTSPRLEPSCSLTPNSCARVEQTDACFLAEHRTDLPLDLARSVEVLQARRLLHDLGHREERDAVAVGEASAPEGCAVIQATQELLHQAGLADPAGAEHREQLARAVGLTAASNACRSCVS